MSSNDDNDLQITETGMENPMRYLIACNAAGGTLSVAKSIAKELGEFPQTSVHIANPDNKIIIKDSTFRRLRKNIQYYMRSHKFLWNLLGSSMYNSLEANKAFRDKLANIIREENPDVICTISPRASRSAALARKDAGKPHIPLVVVLPDHGHVPYYRIIPDADAIIAPGESSKKSLMKQGVRPEKIHVLGCPVDRKFEEISNTGKKELRAKLGNDFDVSDEQRTTALLMGGMNGSKGIIPTVKALIKENFPNLHLIVVTGKNKLAKSELEDFVQQNPKASVSITGYVDNTEQLMGISDIVITKAGGASIAEAQATRTPILINDCWTKYEKENKKYVKDTGVGVTADNQNHVTAIMRSILNNPALLKKIKECQSKVAPHGSSKRSAELLRNLATNKSLEENGPKTQVSTHEESSMPSTTTPALPSANRLRNKSLYGCGPLLFYAQT